MSINRNLAAYIAPTNEDRAGWAREALNRFRKTTGSDAEDAVADLLCDLMHLCQQETKLYGDFDRQLSRATDYYGEEKAEEEDEDEELCTVFVCRACGRPESACSADPCAAVVADREA